MANRPRRSHAKCNEAGFLATPEFRLAPPLMPRGLPRGVFTVIPGLTRNPVSPIWIPASRLRVARYGGRRKVAGMTVSKLMQRSVRLTTLKLHAFEYDHWRVFLMAILNFRSSISRRLVASAFSSGNFPSLARAESAICFFHVASSLPSISIIIRSLTA